MPINSCQIDLNEGVRAGIRIRMDQQNIDVDIREGNGDVSYKYCNRQPLVNGAFKPFFGLLASNKVGNINDIDINAIYIKNMDPRVYHDK